MREGKRCGTSTSIIMVLAQELQTYATAARDNHSETNFCSFRDGVSETEGVDDFFFFETVTDDMVIGK